MIFTFAKVRTVCFRKKRAQKSALLTSKLVMHCLNRIRSCALTKNNASSLLNICYMPLTYPVTIARLRTSEVVISNGS